jgi:lipopolysaccharide/colanic/teichoic acid biosynthesis glycosyltransferase
MKRAVDVVAGCVLGVLALPAIASMALIAAIELRAWPFFLQDRVGRDGRLFRFVKLRTLPPSAPPYADKYALQGIPIRRFSNYLREHHLDELPQLFLVVTGRMSLVGPRPEMPNLHRKFDHQFAAERTNLRPGCTGLWQIGTRCEGLIGEAPEFDRFYVRNVSWRLDAWILWRTVRNFFPGRRLISLDDVPGWTPQQQRVVELEPRVVELAEVFEHTA